MSTSHILLAIMVTLAWGGNFVAVKVGLTELEAFLFCGIRFLLMFFLLLPWLRWKKGLMKPVFWAALCGGPLHFGAIFVGIDLLDNASTAALLTQLGVPFATIFGVIFLGERIGWWRIGGLTLAFLGIVVMSFDPRIFGFWQGTLVMVVAQLFYAGSAILMRKVKGVSMLEMQAWMAAVSAPLLLMVSVMIESNQIEQLMNIDLKGVTALTYTIIISSILGHGVAYFLFQRHPVSDVAIFFLLAPVFGAASSVLMLNEDLTLRMIAGGVIVFVGVAVVTFRERYKQRQQSKALAAGGELS